MNRLRTIAAAMGLAILIASYWWVPALLRPMEFFGVRRVEVSGARYLAPDVVVRGLALRDKASVFDNLGDLKRRLEQQPGIAQATIGRRLPSTVTVEIVEEEPVAMAQGEAGLIALAKDGRPLPYDMSKAPVDVPIVADGQKRLLEALNRIQMTDPGLFADVATAEARGGEMVLDLTQGRVRLDMPVDADIVRSLSSVRRDLASRALPWRELDGRFHGWVVVKREAVPRSTVGRS